MKRLYILAGANGSGKSTISKVLLCVCHDPDTMQKVYDIGRATAERLLPQVRSFLGQGGS